MAEEKKFIMTREGLKAREEELADLKVNKRREVAEEIKEARAQGDLSENAEYDAAKDKQRHLEARIAELENEIENADVVDENTLTSDSVTIGKTVKVLDIEYNEEDTFAMVGSGDADSLNGRISNDSPLGQALMGAKVGDTVSVEAPAGVFKYKVLEITITGA
ncbi:MAG: transcription elongation factor GreA [Lachnospiraceae bacterium]|jgi:transcription elongation factor GreA